MVGHDLPVAVKVDHRGPVGIHDSVGARKAASLHPDVGSIQRHGGTGEEVALADERMIEGAHGLGCTSARGVRAHAHQRLNSGSQMGPGAQRRVVFG